MRRGQVPLPTIRPGGAALLVGSLACAARCAAADCVPAPSAPLISSVPLLIVTTTVPRVVGFMLLDHETQWLPS